MTTLPDTIKAAPTLPGGRGLAVFACGCGQRSSGLWTTAEDPRIASLLRQALESAWRCITSLSALPGTPLEGLREDLLHEISEDSDFGDFHSERLQAIIAVTHALDAALHQDDEPALLRQATACAQAELRIILGAYQERNGTYDGAGDHISMARHVRWQLRDLTDLAADNSVSGIDKVRRRSALQGSYLRSGVMDDDWSNETLDIDEPSLF